MSESQVTRSARRTPAETDRRYWAFLANPSTYRIQDAVSALPEDERTAPNGPVKLGDRALEWKAKGRDPVRGIVVLGEVVAGPVPMTDSDNPFWIVPPPPSDVQRRVVVRYVVPARLPLWLEENKDPVLAELSVSRAQGTRVYWS